MQKIVLFILKVVKFYGVKKCRLGGNIVIYTMDNKPFLEIEEPSDWCMMELVLNKKFRSLG